MQNAENTEEGKISIWGWVLLSAKLVLTHCHLSYETWDKATISFLCFLKDQAWMWGKYRFLKGECLLSAKLVFTPCHLSYEAWDKVTISFLFFPKDQEWIRGVDSVLGGSFVIRQPTRAVQDFVFFLFGY